MVTRCAVLMLAVVMLLLPGRSTAQQASGIAGTVRDTSGGVLPGVTVEAASPALIEKVRTAVTDSDGRYNIVDLRPGAYSVTFTLTGFNTLKRDGVTITAGFTASVNADMQVGALEETITVTGAAPLVDTQNVRQQTTVSSELRTALPTGSQGLIGVTTLIPGLTSSGLDAGGGGATGIYGANQTTSANFHGKAGSKQTYDGMQTNNLSGEGSTSYTMNPATVVETTVEAGGISAESNAAGLLINMVPKEGSNAFSYEAMGTYSNKALQGSNLTDELRARGVTSPGKVLYAYDANFTVGGPIRRDRMWFFAATRISGTQNQIAGRYFNATRGTPFFTPDLDRPQYRQDWLRSQAIRVTWQINQKNKVNGFADPQYYMTRGTGVINAPEANGCWYMWPQGLYQGTWTSPLTSKFLLEGGVSLTQGPFPCTRENMTDLYGFTVSPTDISILESSTGVRYNAAQTYLFKNQQDRYNERFTASYVTGSHAFKIGLQLQQHIHNQTDVVNGDVSYTFTRGIPTSLTQFTTPYTQRNRTKADLGIFAQDQWNIRRLTLNYGVRFDYFRGETLPVRLEAAQFVGVRDFAGVECVPCWTDINPRAGASYDVFGNGQTALKFAVGRYVGRESTVFERANNPVATSVNSSNRAWNDANSNYVPDCDLRNFSANGECGALSNQFFGQSNPRAVRFADDLINGFGVREYFWDLSAEVQHELTAGTSIRGGYYRNWSDHFGTLPRGENTVGVIDNQALEPADFDPFCIMAPVDARLPNGGGYEVCGLYDVTPSKFGVGELLNTRASNYGNGKHRHSDFFTVAFTSRLAGGAQIGASLDTGRTEENICFVVDSPQDLLNCRRVTPFRGQTEIKLNAVYNFPKGFIVSAIFQNLSGVPYEADYVVSNAEIAPSLGRNLAACGTRPNCTATVSVPLIAPRTQFEERRSILDLRLSKVFALAGRARLRANFDLYNVTNSSAVLVPNNNYGAQWRQPGGGFSGGLLVSRLAQFGAQLTF